MKAPKPKPAYEFEYRFKDFDTAKVLRAAQALGATGPLQRTLLINSAFQTPADPALHVRVREVIALKPADSHSLLTIKRRGGKFDEEHETVVGEGATLVLMLGLLGCKQQYTSEKFRDVLVVPGLGELDFDTQPGLPTYLEVESPTLAKLTRLVHGLGLTPPRPTGENGAPASFSPRDLYEEHYGVKGGIVGDLTFSSPANIQTQVTQHAALFKSTLARHRVEAARFKAR